MTRPVLPFILVDAGCWHTGYTVRLISIRNTAAWCQNWRPAITYAKTLPLIRSVLGPKRYYRSGCRRCRLHQWPRAGGRPVGGRCDWSNPGLVLAGSLNRCSPYGGHLLAPLLEKEVPEFPFVALLVSGGHTQLVGVEGIGRYHVGRVAGRRAPERHSTRPPN